MSNTHFCVPSLEQLSFKLTQNCLPSFQSSKQHIIPQLTSLQYSYSRASIQQMLPENQQIEEKNQEFSQLKVSILKSTAANAATLSSIKASTKCRNDRRSISERKMPKKINFNRRLSLHVFSFQQENLSNRNSPIHCSQNIKSWRLSKSNIKKENVFCLKFQQDVIELPKHLSKKKCTIDIDQPVMNLAKTIKINRMTLRQDEAKEKAYMKKIIQNRGSVIHPIQELSKFPPLWQSKKGFRF